MKISLKQFVLTGEFGPVKVGMHKDEILQLLGEPSADNDYETGSGGLNYGWYEFFYSTKNGELMAIQNDHLKADCGNHDEMILFQNKVFEVDTWFLEVDRSFTYKEVVTILENESVAFKTGKQLDSELLIFPSGVYLDFDGRDMISIFNEEGERISYDEQLLPDKNKHILNGIRYFPA